MRKVLKGLTGALFILWISLQVCSSQEISKDIDDESKDVLSGDNFCIGIEYKSEIGKRDLFQESHEETPEDPILLSFIGYPRPRFFTSNCTFSPVLIGPRKHRPTLRYTLRNIFLTTEKWNRTEPSSECSKQIKFLVNALEPPSSSAISNKLCQIGTGGSLWFNPSRKLDFKLEKNLLLQNVSGSYAHIVWRVTERKGLGNECKIQIEHYKLKGEEDCSGDEDSYVCEILDCNENQGDLLGKEISRMVDFDRKDLSESNLSTETTTRSPYLDILQRISLLRGIYDQNNLNNQTIPKRKQKEEINSEWFENRTYNQFPLQPQPAFRPEIDWETLQKNRENSIENTRKFLKYFEESRKIPTFNLSSIHNQNDYKPSPSSSSYSRRKFAGIIGLFMILYCCFMKCKKKNNNLEEESPSNAVSPEDNAPYAIIASNETGEQSCLIIVSEQNALVFTQRPRNEEVGRTTRDETESQPPPPYESSVILPPTYLDAINASATVVN